MSNSLFRSGTSFATPAIPYIPAQAAYTYNKVVTQTVSKPNATGWVTVPTFDSTGQVNGSQLVYAPKGSSILSGKQGSVISGTGYSPGTISYTVQVLVPAVPEQLASPATRVDTPPQGWTSYGNTIASMFSNGVATWTVNSSVVGAVVGFTQNLAPKAGYGHILNGLMFTGGLVYLLSTGASLGSFVTTDVFTQQIYNGVVTYKKNGTTIGTEASLNSPTNLWLGAVLYAAYDGVANPTVAQLSGGTVAVLTPAFDVYGTNTGKGARANVLTPAFVAAIGPLTKVNVFTREFVAYGSDHPNAAQVNVSTRFFTVTSYAGTVAPHIPTTAYVFSDTPWVSATSSTGQLAEVNAQVAAPTSYGGALGHAQVTVLTAAPFLDSFPDIAPNIGLLVETLLAHDALSSKMILIRTMRDGAVLTSHLTSRVSVLRIMRDLARMSGTLTSHQILTGIMRSFMRIADSAQAPAGTSGAVETWVYNLDDQVGSTQYTNYNFNSYAVINDRFYGASDAGLFELTGDTDAGTKIQANMDFGLKNFAMDVRKTIEECYLGMSGEGNLFVKIVVPSDDDTQPDKSYIYSTSSYSASLKQQRVKMGKGLKGNFIGLTLYNVDGNDFELADVEFRVVALTRRIG